MTIPDISIVITNYNYSRYLGKCIGSCLAQCGAFAHEVIIVDDGSTDDSLAIAQQYISSRVRLIQLSNSGVEVASNVGISSAKAEVVVRLDADDYLMPDFLGIILAQLAGSGCAFAYSDYFVVDGADRVLYEESLPPFSDEEIMSRGDFLATGTVYRKSVIQEQGLYDESIINCGLENYHLILRLLKAGHTGLHVPHALFAYRRHDLNISLKKRESIIRYGRRMFSTMALGSYRTNRFHPYRLVVGNE